MTIKSHRKPVLFKTCVGLEPNLECIKSYEWFHPKKHQTVNLA